MRRSKRGVIARISIGWLTAALGAGGCGGAPAPAATSPETSAVPSEPASVIDITVATPSSRGAASPTATVGETADPTVEIVPSGDAAPTLPPSWGAPEVPSFGFADALKKGRVARAAYEHLGAPKGTTDAERKAWFSNAGALVDLASRMYAAAFYASDASRDGRIDAIAEAAQLELALAMRLDEAGIIAMPVSWRTDPSVRATFEEIADGPMRRWRDEARGLARSCIAKANETGAETDAARRCRAIWTAAPNTAHRAGAGGCGCVEGDPLCSASLGGWCRDGKERVK